MVTRDQAEGVHRSWLADPIDTTDPLFQAHGIPGHLQMHDASARVVKIQTFTSRVRRQQHAGDASRERIDCCPPFPATQPSMQHERVGCDRALQVQERVAILGEHDDGFAPPRESTQQAGQRRELRFGGRGPGR